MPWQPETGEVFAGQHDLVERTKANGLRGQFAIFDGPKDSQDDISTHAGQMKHVAVGQMNIPEEHVTFRTRIDWAHEIAGVVVGAHPNTWVIGGPGSDDRAFIAQHDVLMVAAAGNVYTFSNRDLWYPDHAHWTDGTDGHVGDWDNAFAMFATGKVIIATFADQRPGQIVPYSRTVKCGHARDYCYSVILPPDPFPDDSFGLGTSQASVLLGGIAFYLFQLWDTPREIIDVLNTCAVDAGEPGIDEEYGRGIASVTCDTVRNREIGAVAQSLQVRGVSPVLSQMTGADRHGTFMQPQMMALTLRSDRVRPFYALRGRSLDRMTGYAGGRFQVHGTDLYVAAGADYSPFGTWSTRAMPSGRLPFVDAGIERPLLRGVSVLASYGTTTGSNVSTRTGYLGARWAHPLGSGMLRVHAGRRVVYGAVGLPGYRLAGAQPVPFADGSTEIGIAFIAGSRVSRKPVKGEMHPW